MKKLSVFVVLLLLSVSLFSHPWKPSHFVVIDTDAGLDDMRAISMLLASDDVQILGIIVSGGALSPYDGYKKVKSMLNSYHHEGIPVAMNYNIRGQDMPIPQSVIWGDETNLRVPETNSFNKLFKNLLKFEKGKFKLIALASLNSAAELISGDVLPVDRISEIIWSNNSLNKLSGFNANIDIRSANKILREDVLLKVVGYPTGGEFYTEDYFNKLGTVNTSYAKKILSTAKNSPDLQDHDFALKASDEMTAIYLHYPELFSETSVKKNKFLKPVSTANLNDAAIKILNGDTGKGLQTMKELPSDTSFYQADIQQFMSSILTQYGKDEWRASILANEIHQHLGIYSIIGVKMGIRACEYFGVGVDQLNVLSEAGSTPPLSCLNDGIQVSTGATVGHGLFSVSNDNPAPSVKFTRNNLSVTIKLKDEIAQTIDAELKDLVIVNGLDSEIYWEIVRQRAILAWKNLNRYDIFEISQEGL